MRSRLSLCLAVIVSLLSMWPHASFAHSPHHVITEVVATPPAEARGEVFILVTDQIFRSDDAGFAWKILENGLNNQFPFTSFVVSPRFVKDKTIFASTAGDGVYRSTNGGDSWSLLSDGLDKKDIAKLYVAENDESGLSVLAAAKSGGVWRLEHHSQPWRMVLTESVRITDIARADGVTTDGRVIAGDESGRIWQSEDYGSLWEILHELPNAQSITSIAGSVDRLFVGTKNGGLYVSSDNGESFAVNDKLTSQRITDCRGNALDQAVPDRYISDVSVLPDAGNSRRLFVTTWYDGVFVSSDWGNSWDRWDEGLSCDPQADTLHVPHYRNVVSTKNDDGQAVYWIGAFDGLFRGTGTNPHWQQRETLPVGLIKGMAVAEGKRNAVAIGLSTYGGGFYVTEDFGANWTIGNKGLRTARLTGLSFSPTYLADGVIYAGASRRILKSEDFGSSWQQIDLARPGFGTRVARKLVNWGLPAALFGSAGDSASPIVYPTQIVQLSASGGGQILFGTRSHGMMLFDSSSQSIETLWSDSVNVVSGLLASPDFSHDRTLFASIRGIGLFRSQDGGANWMPINRGLSFVERWSSEPDGADFRRDVQVAVSPDVARDNTLFAGSPAGDGLFVSNDRGASWSRLSSVEAQSTPLLSIALSPKFAVDDTILISVKGGGLYRSTDRAKTFEPIGRQLIEDNTSIEYLAFSPAAAGSNTIIAASDENLFTSTDLGGSWATIPRPVRYEDMQEVVRMTGPRELRRSGEFSASTETILASDRSSATLNFVGTGVRWLGSRGPDFGIAQVSIDGNATERVNVHSSGTETMQEIFVVDGLDYGPHSIVIEPVTDPEYGTAKPVGVDAIDVLPPANLAN